MSITIGLYFAFLSLLVSGFVEFVYKIAHRYNIHEPSFLCIQSGTVICILAAISAGGAGWELTCSTVGLGILSGIIGFFAGFSLIHAVGRGPAAVTSAMRRLSFVITSLLAILFLNEQLNAPKAVGTLLAASALMIIAWTKDQSNRPHRTAYITFVCIGLMGFIHKLAAIAGVSPSAFLMIQAGTAHLGTHLFCLKWGGYNFTRSLVRYGILAGVLIALTMVFGIYALRHGDAVVIAPILQLGFLVNAPLSFVFLGEPATKRKIVGFLLGAVAILCFVAEIR